MDEIFLKLLLGLGLIKIKRQKKLKSQRDPASLGGIGFFLRPPIQSKSG